MKSMRIILIGLVLLSAAGIARAADQSFIGSMAVSANNPAPVLDDPERRATLFFNTDPGAGGNCDEGSLDCQSVTVLGYAISKRVAIDLGYRPVAAAENGLEAFSDSLDLKQLTQNLMVGFSYKF